MPKFRKVIKTGNSLAITIPSKIIQSFDVKEGDVAKVTVRHSLSSITYTFTDHPRQLSLINKKNKDAKQK